MPEFTYGAIVLALFLIFYFSGLYKNTRKSIANMDPCSIPVTKWWGPPAGLDPSNPKDRERAPSLKLTMQIFVWILVVIAIFAAAILIWIAGTIGLAILLGK